MLYNLERLHNNFIVRSDEDHHNTIQKYLTKLFARRQKH